MWEIMAFIGLFLGCVVIIGAVVVAAAWLLGLIRKETSK
jgi:hypothetical protein